MDLLGIEDALLNGDVIYHPERDTYYELVSTLPVKIDGSWSEDFILYTDLTTKTQYVRKSNDFSNFTLA